MVVRTDSAMNLTKRSTYEYRAKLVNVAYRWKVDRECITEGS
jgi:hypothetical protein